LKPSDLLVLGARLGEVRVGQSLVELGDRQGGKIVLVRRGLGGVGLCFEGGGLVAEALGLCGRV
jgi:hypothetical protein